MAIDELELLRAIYRRLDREGVVYDNPGVSEEDIKGLFRKLKRLLEQEQGAAPVPPDSPPPEAMAAAAKSEGVIVHCDGGSRGNPGPAGFGFVILDSDGHVLHKGKGFAGYVTNNVAEYQGAIAGLRQAAEMGAKSVTLKSDSELMVHQINGRYRVKKPNLIPLHAEVMGLLRGFEQWRATHVPREENALADALANEAMDRGC
ncbi:MAG TPA: ribonuclease HI family protein [Candidatus Brocadiia bacterium]|nr:ribonuclease HI family protein [Candidatus Brocadiia bacterium]